MHPWWLPPEPLFFGLRWSTGSVLEPMQWVFKASLLHSSGLDVGKLRFWNFILLRLFCDPVITLEFTLCSGIFSGDSNFGMILEICELSLYLMFVITSIQVQFWRMCIHSLLIVVYHWWWQCYFMWSYHRQLSKLLCAYLRLIMTLATISIFIDYMCNWLTYDFRMWFIDSSIVKIESLQTT